MTNGTQAILDMFSDVLGELNPFWQYNPNGLDEMICPCGQVAHIVGREVRDNPFHKDCALAKARILLGVLREQLEKEEQHGVRNSKATG